MPMIMQHGCSHVYREMAVLPEDHPLRQEARDTKVQVYVLLCNGCLVRIQCTCKYNLTPVDDV